VLAPSLEASGPDGAVLGKAALGHAEFAVRGDAADLADQRWTLDGRDLTHEVEPRAGALVLRPRSLGDGDHVLLVRGKPNLVRVRASRRFEFRIDTKPPVIRLTAPAVARAWEPLALRGSAPGAVAVSADGRRAHLRGGRFVLRHAVPVPARVVLVATDEAGNRATRRVPIALVPRRPAVPVRAVHVTSYAWADKALHAGVMRLIDERRINTLEIDLKDESRIVGFGAWVPYGRQLGSIRRVYDLAATVRQLHRRGIRVIGRLV
jgi:hypothetical protein